MATFARMEELYDSMRQGSDEKITEYLDRANYYNAQYSKFKPHFGYRVVQGLRDRQKREMIHFHMKPNSVSGYSQVRKMWIPTAAATAAWFT